MYPAVFSFSIVTVHGQTVWQKKNRALLLYPHVFHETYGATAFDGRQEIPSVSFATGLGRYKFIIEADQPSS